MPIGFKLLLAVGLPLVLLLLATWWLETNRQGLPGWMRRLQPRQALLWNCGIALVLGLSLLRWLLLQ